MGIAERKEREKLEMRERILSTAMQLFVEMGFEKTSIRKIADAIEYSPGTIYLYFKDKTELFYELHNRAFRRFGAEFEKAKLISDPFERLRFIGKVYLDFGLNNPEHYDLMFIMYAPMRQCEDDAVWESGRRSFDVLEATVKECMEKGRIEGKDYRVVAYNMWSHVHGLVSLANRERLKMYEDVDIREIVDQAHDQMMAWVDVNAG